MKKPFLCAHCGSEFVAQYTKNYTPKFCSSTCSINHAWANPRYRAKQRRAHKGQAPVKIYRVSGSRHHNYKPRVTVACPTCGKRFRVRQSYASVVKNTFCSSKCNSEWRSSHMSGDKHPRYSKKAYRCFSCGTEVLRAPSGAKGAVFCSYKCMGRYNSVTRNGSKSPFWRGGVDDGWRGDNWKAQRGAARKRDNNTCQLCGKKPNNGHVDVHHIKPFRAFGYVAGKNTNYIQANDLSNLICLCHSCHMRVEWDLYKRSQSL